MRPKMSQSLPKSGWVEASESEYAVMIQEARLSASSSLEMVA